MKRFRTLRVGSRRRPEGGLHWYSNSSSCLATSARAACTRRSFSRAGLALPLCLAPAGTIAVASKVVSGQNGVNQPVLAPPCAKGQVTKAQVAEYLDQRGIEHSHTGKAKESPENSRTERAIIHGPRNSLLRKDIEIVFRFDNM